VTGALVYLTRRTVVNRLRRQVARVRSPRYALALLLGSGWVAAVVWERAGTASGPPPSATWLEFGGALGVLLLVAWAWLGSPDARVLAFSPAEVTFLFPAPITRRGLIHYKLLRTQVIVLVNVGIWTALVGLQHPGISPWLRAASFWVLITTLTLHRLGAALVRTSLAEHGRFGLRHRVVSVALVTAALGAVGSGLWAAWPELVAAARVGGPALRGALVRMAAQPGIAAVLWPLRVLARPLAAGSMAEWRAAILPPIGLLALHYLWVLRSDSAFEEAAAEASLARARRQAARSAPGAVVPRGGRALSPPLFPLAPTGWPAIALLWKNLAAVVRRRRARNIAVGLVIGGGIVAIVSSHPGSTLSEVTGALALTWLGFVVLLGPQWVRNDLRGDLIYADLLRSYPVRGWAVVAMEATASAITLTLIELGLATLAYLAFLNDAALEISRLDRTLLLGAALVLLPPLNFTMMLLQNGVAVLFPGWVRMGAPPAGIEALGQQLLSTTASWLLLGATLAAPAGVATVTFFGLEGAGETWAGICAATAGLLMLAAETFALVRWLGGAFERLEPGAARG
jgi:ABC-2 type transport system permease protein